VGIRTWPGLAAVLERADSGLVAKWGLAMLHLMLHMSSEGVDNGLPLQAEMKTIFPVHDIRV
jgi:hypothetical protein